MLDVEGLCEDLGFKDAYEDLEAALRDLARLRSDEWLEKASEEIGGTSALAGATERALAILRKHREGR